MKSLLSVIYNQNSKKYLQRQYTLRSFYNRGFTTIGTVSLATFVASTLTVALFPQGFDALFAQAMQFPGVWQSE